VARALRRHLEHAREFHGAAYVPRGSARAGGAALESAVGPGAEAKADVGGIPAPAGPSGGAVADAAASGARESVEEVKKRVLRQKAQEWSSEKKLAYLQEKNLGDCRRCVLARTRNRIVFGVGDPEADIMFVGEAPGFDEDRSGEPFVGAAGRKLTAWIEELGFTRERVYIANVLKCRPPNNRDPRPEEVERCSPFLEAQIRVIQPKVIVALGRHAGCLLLRAQFRMYEMRGEIHHYEDSKHGVRVPLVVTYHPSYVLRREGEAKQGRRGQADNSELRKSENELVMMDLQRALSLAS
jgi:DNA polymerase